MLFRFLIIVNPNENDFTRICLAFQQRTGILVYMIVFQRINIFSSDFSSVLYTFSSHFYLLPHTFWSDFRLQRYNFFLHYANYLAILLHFRYFLYQFKNPPFHHLANIVCVTIPSLNYSSPGHLLVVSRLFVFVKQQFSAVLIVPATV